MARRRGCKKVPEHSALGLRVRDHAIRRISELRDAKIAAMVKFDLTVQDVIDILFTKDKQEILRKAKGVVEESSSTWPFQIGPGVSVRVLDEGFEKAGYAFPCQAAASPNFAHPKIASFLQSAKEVQDITDEHCIAAGVLTWMDKTMGKGTLRYYFPAVLSLLPENHNVEMELVDRVIQPPGLAQYLPAIRSAATTIASGLLLPKPAAKDNPTLQLQFSSSRGFVSDGIHYACDGLLIRI